VTSNLIKPQILKIAPLAPNSAACRTQHFTFNIKHFTSLQHVPAERLNGFNGFFIAATRLNLSNLFNPAVHGDVSNFNF